MGTNFNYDDTSHRVIFDNINGGSGSGPLQDASQGWQKLGQEIGATGKSYVQRVISNILANRTGAAAEAAVSTTSAMLPWMDGVTQTAAASAQRAQQQAEYWVTAKNNVPPVPPAPKSASFFSNPGEWVAEKMDWFPGVTSDQEQAKQRQQDAAEQARQAMRVYQASSNPNVDAAPAFTAPQALDGSIGSLPLTVPSAYGAAMRWAGAPPPAIAGGMAAHQPAAYQPAAVAPAVHHPAVQAPAATVSQLAGERHATLPAGQAASSAAGRAAASSEGRAGAGNAAASQGVPLGALAASAGVGGDTAGRGRASVRRGSAEVHVAGAGGAHHAGFAPRPSREFGPRPTAGSHSALDELSGARNSGATTRAASASGYGQPFAGGAGQRGEPDREHRSKYLLHDDSNSIIGDLPPTAPPVIGADY